MRTGSAQVNAAGRGRIRVEVVYARRDEQTVIALEMAAGATVADALARSGIASRLPGRAPIEGRVGVHGKPVALDACLRDGDRVEIYRPLAAPPAETRRRRATRRA